MGIPMAESSPVHRMGLIIFRPIPTPHVQDILEPSANEQARTDYLERQMQNMSSV